jgi:hypothetical protein
MKPIIIVSPKLTKLLSLVIDIEAITLFPFIISRREMSEETLRHETIHILQQKELFVVFFYMLYGWDYLKGIIKYKNKRQAYFQIRFEQEAYMYMYTSDYLDVRQKYKWKQYKV